MMYIKPERIADLTTVKALGNSPYKFLSKKHAAEIAEALRDEITWRQITNYLNYIYGTEMKKDTLYKHYQKIDASANSQNAEDDPSRSTGSDAVANSQPAATTHAHSRELNLQDVLRFCETNGYTLTAKSKFGYLGVKDIKGVTIAIDTRRHQNKDLSAEVVNDLRKALVKIREIEAAQNRR